MERHDPERTCIGCRETKSKSALIRIVRTAEGSFHVDPSGKMNGRGAYLCPDPSCIAAAFRKGAFAKSFRMPVSAEVKDQLIEELKNIEKINL